MFIIDINHYWAKRGHLSIWYLLGHIAICKHSSPNHAMVHVFTAATPNSLEILPDLPEVYGISFESEVFVITPKYNFSSFIVLTVGWNCYTRLVLWNWAGNSGAPACMYTHTETLPQVPAVSQLTTTMVGTPGISKAFTWPVIGPSRVK